MDSILPSIIGYIALTMVILAFQSKSRKGVLLLFFVAHLFFMVHFYMIGATTAALINVIALVRDLLFIKKEKLPSYNTQLWPTLFSIVFLLTAIPQWHWYNLLPAFGMVIESYGLWIHDEKLLRKINLLPRPLWFGYALVVGSLPSGLTEIFVTTSVLIAIFRYDIKKRTPHAIDHE